MAVSKSHQGSGRCGCKIERELSEVNTRAVSGGQNELIGKFKVAMDDVICIGAGYEAHVQSNRN